MAWICWLATVILCGLLLRRCSLYVQEACEEDLVSTCSTSLKEMEEDEPKRSSALKCLQQFRDELHSQACRDQVCSPAAACTVVDIIRSASGRGV
jgi:hypothetical protein